MLPPRLSCTPLVLAVVLLGACASSSNDPIDPGTSGSGGNPAAGKSGASGASGKGGEAGQGGASGGSGQAGSSGSSGQAGDGGASGTTGGASGSAGTTTGGTGGAGASGSAGASGQAGQGGAACNPDQAPAGSECTYDTDCALPDGQSTECAEVVCDVCQSWTCKLKARNVGLGCTATDKCSDATCSAAGACVAKGAKSCKPTDSCSSGACNPSTGECEFTPVTDGTACGAGDKCTIGQTCQSGVCQGGQPKCQSNACRTATCYDFDGSCVYSPKLPLPSCDDGDLCTTDDTCALDSSEAAVCKGKAITLDCSGVGGNCEVGACNPSTGTCMPIPAKDGASCDDGLSCTSADACLAGVCQGKIDDIDPLFYEAFSDTSKGWQLEGGWAFGAAVGSTPKPTAGNPDPGTDTTQNNSDNQVAGAVLGGKGAITTALGGPYYLTSPVIDVSTLPGQVFVRFSRWLNCGSVSTMRHTIEVFDGTAWQTLFVNGVTPIKDAAWSVQSINVTAHKNPGFRIRFGYRVDSLVNDYTGWNLDDLIVGSPGCDTGSAGTGGAAGASGAAGTSGAAGDGGMSGAGGVAGVGGAGAAGMSGAGGEAGQSAGGAAGAAGMSGAAGGG